MKQRRIGVPHKDPAARSLVDVLGIDAGERPALDQVDTLHGKILLEAMLEPVDGLFFLNRTTPIRPDLFIRLLSYLRVDFEGRSVCLGHIVGLQTQRSDRPEQLIYDQFV